MKHKVILVGGARPNFMKIAPLLREFRKYKDKFVAEVVHTGQHYDYEMSKIFFEDLSINKPCYYLGVGSGSHAEQTAEIMKKFEKRCIETKPTLVVVVGDVNSTLASSIVAKKLGIEVAHIEAGLRSGDMSMPEEINRIVTDSISDFLFVTEKSAINNLEKEGKSKDRIFFVGNTMIDSLVVALKKLDNINIKEFRASSLKKELGTYGVVTLHRPSNVDDRVQLLKIINILNKVSHRIPLIFPMHPRTAKKIRDFSIRCSSNIYVEKPLGYLEFIFLCKNAKFVLTDSGGIQEETTFLKVPCFTLRKNTERPVTVEIGTNVLLGEDVNRLPLLINRILGKDCKHSDIPPFWDGRAAERIVQVIKKIKNAD